MSGKSKKAKSISYDQGRRNSIPRNVALALGKAASERLPCLLCGGDPVRLGYFTPHDTGHWGFPVGYQAARVYTLCETHQPRHGQAQHNRSIADKVEQVLWDECQAMQQAQQLRRAAPWN
jgi:hypothetical protein